MIGIIGAMDVEIKLLLEKLKGKKENKVGNYTFYEGLMNAKEVVILKSGIGKVASSCGAILMCELYHPDFIINTGIAGGLSGLHTSDILLAESLSYADVDATAFHYRLGQVPGFPESFPTDKKLRDEIKDLIKKMGYEPKEGHILTQDTFVTSLNQIRVDYPYVCACEMEGASIAQACYLALTKFISIRFISDVVGTSEQVSNYIAFEEEMARRSASICYNVISILK